jgi:hypothetical protein
MLIDFFKPEDFDHPDFNGNSKPPEYMAATANAKLKHEGKIMWHYDNEDRWQFSGDDRHSTHRGLLINIEPIEKCTHPAEKVTSQLMKTENKPWGGRYGTIFTCECGAKVQPKEFEEIK